MTIRNIIFMIYPPLHTGKNDLFKKLAELFYAKDNYNLIAITHGKHSQKFLDSIEAEWEQAYDLVDYIKSYQDAGIEKLVKFAEKYKLAGINETFEHATQVFSKGYPGAAYSEEQQNRMLIALLLFFESVLSKHRNSVLVDEGVAGLYTPLYQLLPHFDSHVFSLKASRISGKFAITHKGYEKFDKAEKKYYASDYTQPELDEAELFIKGFLENRTKPAWFERYKPKGRLTKIFDKVFSRDFLGFLLIIFDHLRFPKNMFMPYFRFWLLKILQNFYKPMVHYKMVNWDSISPGQPYFIYPLHVQPEASINVLGTYYTDQLNLIKQISLALPVGTLLYVKEHSAIIGKRNHLKFYRSIKKIRNIRLIDPFLDPHSLIENAAGIITISGTMGYEAILYKKPVILFGEPFYKFYKNCWIVENIKDLRVILEKCQNEASEIPDTDVIEFIAATSYGQYSGNIYFEDKNSLADENIEAIRKAIKTEIDHIRQSG